MQYPSLSPALGLLYLQVSSTDNFCKQFGPRSGLTKRQAWSGSKLFDTLVVIHERICSKIDFKKINRRQKSIKNYKGGKILWGVKMPEYLG